MTIPKIIHYCWFGRGPKPALAERCIASWRAFHPGYEIKEWNEDNYDVRKIRYVAEAYAAKRYAFVSDYARFDILYHHGGLYFDTDVELIRPIDDILMQGPHMGLECDPDLSFGRGFSVNPGLGIACEPGHGLYKAMLDLYATLHFMNADGTCNMKTVVEYTTELLQKRGLVPADGVLECEGVRLYPSEYFNPMRPNGKIVLTPNTRSIHHFAASWHTPRERIALCVQRRLGRRAGQVVSLLTHNPVYIVRRILRYLRSGR